MNLFIYLFVVGVTKIVTDNKRTNKSHVKLTSFFNRRRRDGEPRGWSNKYHHLALVWDEQKPFPIPELTDLDLLHREFSFNPTIRRR